MSSKSVKITYKNWKGETSPRNIEPIEIYFGSNEWHREPQWLMTAMDLDKGRTRTFAIKDISAWNPVQ